MNALNFVYWLNGFFELTDAKELTSAQVQIIKDHLKLAMTKVTPDVFDFAKWPPSVYEYPNTFEQQIICGTGKQYIHGGPTSITCSAFPVIQGFTTNIKKTI